ncbi:DUF6653 family protein [Calothrix rhizosoleniae]|uniref:DUF6653 family protein n=1 Tax=Calothrix rhizosoleniae TaxID=888997 RepID=UPI000B4A347C|nr:DUF6653 family protein [Calothrix rhizosoleniae]
MNAQKLANIFHMTDTVWARHANPWSVWTRYGSLPLLIGAIWSRVWLSWGALIPTLVVILWIWLNPRVFPKPNTTRQWASKGVIGERIWLNQKQVPIPSHHHPVIAFTNTINAIGFGICVWGLWSLAPWPTVLGLSWVILGKTWFLDRMVWLCDEMAECHPQYQNWLY